MFSIRLHGGWTLVTLFSEFSVKAFSFEWLLPVLAFKWCGESKQRGWDGNKCRLALADWADVGSLVMPESKCFAFLLMGRVSSRDQVHRQTTSFQKAQSSWVDQAHISNLYFLPLIKALLQVYIQSPAAPPSSLKWWWNSPTPHQKLRVLFDSSLSWACFSDRRCDINFSEISFRLQLRKIRFIIIQTNLRENGEDFNDP